MPPVPPLFDAAHTWLDSRAQLDVTLPDVECRVAQLTLLLPGLDARLDRMQVMCPPPAIAGLALDGKCLCKQHAAVSVSFSGRSATAGLLLTFRLLTPTPPRAGQAGACTGQRPASCHRAHPGPAADPAVSQPRLAGGSAPLVSDAWDAAASGIGEPGSGMGRLNAVRCQAQPTSGEGLACLVSTALLCTHQLSRARRMLHAHT